MNILQKLIRTDQFLQRFNMFSTSVNLKIKPDKTSTAVDPLQVHDYFHVRNLVTVRDLFIHRCHIGHKDTMRNPFMTPYLFGSRQHMDIIDLDKTHTLLGEALNFTAHVASRGGIIIFISRNKMMSPLVERTAQICEEYAHTRPWAGPVFTDADNFFDAVTRLPDLIVFLHTQSHIFQPHSALYSASKMLIPSTGLVDTNCDPRLVDYPVPSNDDSPSSVRLMAALFCEAVLRGKKMPSDNASK